MGAGDVTSIDDWIRGGLSPRRDHSPGVELALRNVRFSSRLGGLPDKGGGPTRDQFGRVFPDMKAFGADEDTVGDEECWGLWQWDPSSSEPREIPGWANAWPSVVSKSQQVTDGSSAGGGLTTSRSSSSTEALPVRRTDWKPDTRFKPKEISLPSQITTLPAGWPLVVIAGTEERSQQDLGFPSGGLCVAVHYGGKDQDPLGSLVYDVTAAGELDPNAWAREQSGRRVYLLPRDPGAGGFVFDPQAANPTTQTTTSAKARAWQYAPGGLAWQLGPTVAGQAGHGACSDLPSFQGAPQATDGPTAGSSSAQKGPTPGSVAALQQGPAAQKGQAGAGKIQLVIFGGFGTVKYDIPWDGTQASLDWIRKNGETAGYAAGGRLVSANPTGTVSPPAPPPPPPSTQGKNGNGGGSTTSAPPSVIALATYRAFGPHDCGGPDCQHQIAVTPRGEPIYSLHQRETTIIRGDTGDCAAKHDKIPWKPVEVDGPFWVESYRRVDVNDSHAWLSGQKQGLRKIQTTCHIATPPGYPTDGPSSGTDTTGGLIIDTHVGDTTITLGIARSGRSSSSCLPNDYYPSFSQAIGVTEILGRALAYDGPTDTRHSFTLSAEQRRLWATAPVAAKIQPIQDQSGASDTVERDCSRYRTGHAKRGGFVFAPPGYDVYKEQRGEAQCPCDTSTSYVYLPNSRTSLVFGSPLKSALPKDAVIFYSTTPGVVMGRAVNASGDTTSTAQLFPPTPPTLTATPAGYISGFDLAYNASSPSLVDVTGSIARDDTDTLDIEPSTPASVDYLTSGVGLNANDALMNSDTGLTGNSNIGVLGGATYGNSALSASIIPFLNGRALTGTLSFGAPAAAISTVTGTGTKFLSEIKVGDLIGNGSVVGLVPVGYMMVVSVDSDTSCKVIRGFLSALGVSAGTCSAYENVCVQVGVIPACRITEIAVSGDQLYSPTKFNNGTTGVSGLDVIVGQPAAAATLTYPATGLVDNIIPTWIYVFARSKADGTATLSWSTQRTTPYTPSTLTGYAYKRRVGVLPLDVGSSSNFVVPFTQTNLGRARLYRLEKSSNGGYPEQGLGAPGGTANVWTRLSLNDVVPPTSKLAKLELIIFKPAADQKLFVRASGMTATGERAQRAWASAGTISVNEVDVATDDAQCIDYVSANDANNPYQIIATGYYDVP